MMYESFVTRTQKW